MFNLGLYNSMPFNISKLYIVFLTRMRITIMTRAIMRFIIMTRAKVTIMVKGGGPD